MPYYIASGHYSAGGGVYTLTFLFCDYFIRKII